MAGGKTNEKKRTGAAGMKKTGRGRGERQDGGRGLWHYYHVFGGAPSSKRGGVRIELRSLFAGFAARLRPQAASAGDVAFPGGAAVESRRDTGVLSALFGKAGQTLAAEQDRWLPWCVAAFAGGIAVYFGLPG